VTTAASRPSPLPAILVAPQSSDAATPPLGTGVPAESRADRKPRGLPRVGRALLVGAAASLLDLGLLSAGIRWIELGATVARLIALVASGLLAFYGSRSFAFRAQSGDISRQAKLFVLTEALGLALNLTVFRLLVSYASWVPPELTSQLANFLVFLVFTYPMRALLVFRLSALAAGPAERARPLTTE